MHRRWRPVPLLPAPSGTKIVRKRGRLSIAEFVRKTRHPLHALVMREVLRPDAVQYRDNQVAWIGKPERAVVAYRHHRVRHAIAIEAVAAGAQRHIAAPPRRV